MHSYDSTHLPDRIDVFFYGLYMDVDILRALGADPMNARRAWVDGYALHIGNRATLTTCTGARAYGMLIELSPADLDRLYAAPDLAAYRAETVRAQLLAGGSVNAQCYNLPRAPAPRERNSDYAVRLQTVLRKLNFPAEYIASVR